MASRYERVPVPVEVTVIAVDSRVLDFSRYWDEFMKTAMRSFGVPAHVLRGDSGTAVVGGQKVPIQAWEMNPVKPPEPLPPNET